MDNELLSGYLMGQNDSGSNNNDMFGGGGWGGLLGLIVVASLFGWGGMGGGFGFGGNGLQGMATRADINAGFQFNDLTNGIRGLERGLCDGFYGVQNSFSNLSAQLAQCCCDNRAAISDLKYTIATEDCATRNLMQNNVRDIIDSQNAGTRAILDFLTQDKIATLTAENQSLKFAASQANQNAFITANQEAQTAELIRRLGRDCPVPAYVVPNPNCCYGNPVGIGYNGGCGCANGYTQ
ncbi:MAG: hypothetical protein II266_06795 [Clostridia bacterium]|nr:hypothetical protein [Clostridia bacterium]